MLKRIGYALLVTLAVLGLAEAGLRLYAPDWQKKQRTLASTLVSTNGIVDHPLFGRSQRPGISLEREAYHKRFIYRINDLGLRGPPMSLEKAPGTYRIIFVGASVVESAYLPEAEMFPFLVERKLNERLGGKTRVEVGVLAKPGATSETSLAQIANMALELSPDLVVLLTGGDWAKSLDPDYEPTLMYMGKSLPLRPSLAKTIEHIVLETRIAQLVQRTFEKKPLTLGVEGAAARRS